MFLFSKSCSIARMMGCCSCFGFTRKRKPVVIAGNNNGLSQKLLPDYETDYEDQDNCSYSEVTSTGNVDESEIPSRAKSSEEILYLRIENGTVCRQFPVKETHKVVRTEVRLL